MKLITVIKTSMWWYNYSHG